jgi:hypothetical protein
MLMKVGFDTREELEQYEKEAKWIVLGAQELSQALKKAAGKPFIKLVKMFIAGQSMEDFTGIKFTSDVDLGDAIFVDIFKLSGCSIQGHLYFNRSVFMSGIVLAGLSVDKSINFDHAKCQSDKDSVHVNFISKVQAEQLFFNQSSFDTPLGLTDSNFRSTISLDSSVFTYGLSIINSNTRTLECGNAIIARNFKLNDFNAEEINYQDAAFVLGASKPATK